MLKPDGKMCQEYAGNADVRLQAMIRYEELYNNASATSQQVAIFFNDNYDPAYQSASMSENDPSTRKTFTRDTLPAVFKTAHDKRYRIGPMWILQVAPTWIEYTYAWFNTGSSTPSLYFHCVAEFNEKGQYKGMKNTYRTKEPYKYCLLAKYQEKQPKQ